MSANTFMLACRALWGSQWQSEAARGLGISLSSVLRYAAGERVVPREVYERLAEVIDQRIDEFEREKPKVIRAQGDEG